MLYATHAYGTTRSHPVLATAHQRGGPGRKHHARARWYLVHGQRIAPSHGRASGAYGVAGGPTSSTADELEKFARLREQGVITNEEFETQKAVLLG